MLKYVTLYAFIVIMANCNKYDDTQAAANLEVPPYTQTGANTFGCFINGKVWANFGETFVKPIEDIFGGGSLQPNLVHGSFNFDQNPNDSVFYVGGTYTLSKKGTVLSQTNLTLAVPKGNSFLGTHLLTDSVMAGARYDDINYNANNNFGTYRSLPRNPFIVIIKKDSVTASGRHIVSGTFSGMIYRLPTRLDPSIRIDSMRVTDGVFDTGF